MSFDFAQAFKDAVTAGINAAKPGGKAAEDWVRQSAEANEESFRNIAGGVAAKTISKETAEVLLQESGRALQSEAAALKALLKAAAQAGVNAFLASLFGALKAGLKLAL